jgi:hypothetical protein
MRHITRNSITELSLSFSTTASFSIGLLYFLCIKILAMYCSIHIFLHHRLQNSSESQPVLQCASLAVPWDKGDRELKPSAHLYLILLPRFRLLNRQVTSSQTWAFWNDDITIIIQSSYRIFCIQMLRTASDGVFKNIRPPAYPSTENCGTDWNETQCIFTYSYIYMSL